jgi:hypothetical protein
MDNPESRVSAVAQTNIMLMVKINEMKILSNSLLVVPIVIVAVGTAAREK